MAEQYRALRTRIAHVENGKRFRTLLVTSPTARDGKTLTALNLALSMGQEFHRKVLVVDGDLRKSTMHKHLGIPASPGLSDVLNGTATLDEALVFLPQFNLTVLPSGGKTSSPAEILGSAEMRQVIDVLSTQFDRVLIDTPPVVAVADVGVLGPLVDGVLLVVRAGRTTRPAIDRALREVHPAQVLGLVLNDVEETTPYYKPYSTPHRGPGMGRLRLNPSRRSA
jgi:capsular exopolysaccharide synthesis family protein